MTGGARHITLASPSPQRVLTRRQLLSSVAGLPLAVLLRHRAPAQTSARIVVVGGGFGGATCAKYLRRADPGLEVSLVTAQERFISCPFSNAALVGLRDLASLIHSYHALRARYGVRLIHSQATRLEPAHHRLRLADGQTLAYDKLVLSPGIELRWGEPEGYDMAAAEVFPHAWQAGPQTRLLRRQLQAMPDGGLVVIAVPETPYRCPPGPYERASLIAHYLSRTKPRSKILILDAKDRFTKDSLFLDAWQRLYPGLLEWVPATEGGRVIGVDSRAGVVRTEFDEYTPAVANIIAPQRAASIARTAGLDRGTGWCSITGGSFASTVHPDVHIIGDAALANPMPKSAFSANVQAKACALAIVAQLRGEPPPEPVLMNTCYSLVAPDYAISITAVYRLDNDTITLAPGSSGTSPLEAPEAVRALEAEYARAWYANITADTFG